MTPLVSTVDTPSRKNLDPCPLWGGWFSAFFRMVTHQRVNFAGGSRTMDSIVDKYPVGSPEWRWLEGYGDMKESSELSSLSEDKPQA